MRRARTRRPRGRRLRGDEGATTELVIAAPAFLFTILLIVQAALYFHAIAVASAAAQDGAREASLAGGTGAGPDLAAGEQVAQDLVDTMAPDLLAGATATGQVVDGGEAVRMTVQGPVAQVLVIPGLDFSITVNEVAETPVEAFRPGGGAP
jgi:Flp pilus assembly protein TadG